MYSKSIAPEITMGNMFYFIVSIQPKKQMQTKMNMWILIASLRMKNGGNPLILMVQEFFLVQ